MKKTFFAALAVTLCALNLHAQNTFITTNFSIPTQKITACAFNGTPIECDDASASFKWFCFDEGQRTAIISIDWPTFLSQYQVGKPHVKKLEFSYTGKNLKLVKSVEGSDVYYCIMRGNTMCGVFANITKNGQKVWRAAINFGENYYLIDDVYLGMNLDELKEITSRDLKYSKMKFIGNDGGNKVYELTWLGERDKYVDLSGTTHSELHFDEPNGRFWFDAQGRLVKWYQWREVSNM